MNSRMGSELSVTKVLLGGFKNKNEKNYHLKKKSAKMFYLQMLRKINSSKLVHFEISLALDRRYYGTFWDGSAPPPPKFLYI